MGYLQQYNDQKGVSKPTATGSGYLKQYNSLPPQEKKKLSTPKPIITRQPKNIVIGDKPNLIQQAQSFISPIANKITSNPVVQKTAKDIYSKIVEEGRKIIKQKTGSTPEQIQKGAEETGKLLQKTPNLDLGTKGKKLFKATDTETAAINFISNFPSAIAQSFGQSLELVSTDKGRKRIKNDAINLPKTMEQVKTHVERKEWQQAFEVAMSNTAITVGLDVAGFIPGEKIAATLFKGLKGTSVARKTAQTIVKEAIEETAQQEAKAVGKFGFTERVSGKDLGFQEVVDKTPKPSVEAKTVKPVVEVEPKPKQPVVSAKEAEARVKSQKVLKLMGNDLEDISIIGSTARGKVNPNDLDILITPKKSLGELRSDQLYDRIALQKTFEDELKPLFPDKKLHVTISEYKPERGAKISISQLEQSKSKPKEIVKEEIITKESTKSPGYTSKNAKAIQQTFYEELSRLSRTAKNQEELITGSTKIINEGLEKLKGDRTGLAGLRTAMNKEMFDLAGVSSGGSYKQKYAEFKAMLDDPSIGKYLNLMEDRISDIDQLIKTTPEKTKVITKTIEKVKTEKPIQQPIGKGKPKVSRLGAGVEAKAVENKLVDNLGSLPEYKQVNMKDQSRRATDLLAKDSQKAIDIALGKRTPPADILPESVFVAVENKAIAENNVELLRQLATSVRSTEATAMGQRIRALAERNPDSAVGAMKEIVDERVKAVEKRVGKSVDNAIKEETAKIKAKVKPVDKYDWGKFVESLKC